MTIMFAAPLVQLAAAEVCSGVSAVSGELRVLTGRMWLTIEADARDYWLHAGDALQIPPGRLVVVEAHRLPCMFTVASGARHAKASYITSKILSTY